MINVRYLIENDLFNWIDLFNENASILTEYKIGLRLTLFFQIRFFMLRL